MYIFQLMDFYSASGMPLLWICFWETVALSWVFGAARFREAIHEMTGHRPPYLFYLCWKYFGPLVMAGVFLFYLVSITQFVMCYMSHRHRMTPGLLLPGDLW